MFCDATPRSEVPSCSTRRRAPLVLVRNLEAGDVVLAHRMGVFGVLRLLSRVVGAGVTVFVEGRPRGGVGVAGSYVLALHTGLAGPGRVGRGEDRASDAYGQRKPQGDADNALTNHG